MQATKSAARFEVTADGAGVVGHAGVALLAELADRLGLTCVLDWRARRTQTSRHRHQTGRVLRDVAVMLADGGDCLSDLVVLREQPELFGPVASTATAWRVLERVATDPDGLAGLRAARAHARARAWQAGGWPDSDGGPLLVDLDATLVEAHSDKEGAAGTFKGGFGFHPLLAFLDRADGTAEPLAGILREGNAAANTTADLVELADLALAQLPQAGGELPVLVRSDSAGASHGLVDHLRARGVRFSIGFDLDQRVRAAILATPESRWQPAIDADGTLRAGAEVAELTGQLDLSRWPAGTRLLCRREDPHPGAQLSFSDIDGHRFQGFITDQPDPNITTVELRHRQHARIEQRIRGAKATGLGNLRFDRLRRNAVWLELVLLALDLVAWAQVLLLDDELAVAQPKTLRYRLWHQAAKLCRHARRLVVRLQRRWPWSQALVQAFVRLRALPLRS